MSKDFYKATEERRTFYNINNEEIVSKEIIIERINFVTKHSPTAFNSQSPRVIVLFNEHHNKLWEITKTELKKVVPADNFSETEQKINSFKSGYGTILYFEETKTVSSLQEQYPLYKDNFPVWASQSQGILQNLIWTALVGEGLGVSLQHYNPLIDDEVKKQWNVADSWKLVARMPFGKPVSAPEEKQFLPIGERVLVF